MIARLHDDQSIVLDQMSTHEDQILWKEFSVAAPGARYVDTNSRWDGVFRYYNRAKGKIARPFLKQLRTVCAKHELPLQVRDHREASEFPPTPADEVNEDFIEGITLDPHQIRAIRAACKEECGIIDMPTGSGKCLGRGTPVLMYDLSIKMVEDVQVGDLLMGDDSTSREVLSTTSGVDELYRIDQKNGDPYVVNSAHVLTLCRTPDGKSPSMNYKVRDIPLAEYLGFSKTQHHLWKGFKVRVSKPDRPVPMDAYAFGVWLGDGISADCTYVLNDSTDGPIIDYLNDLASRLGMVLVKHKEPTRAIDYYAIRLYEGVHKHIPNEYLDNSERVRLEVLAGIIDADGGGCDHDTCSIILKRGPLPKSLAVLARSLGFRVTTSDIWKTCDGVKGDWYASITISGNLDRLPTKVAHKQSKPRKMNKRPLIYGIKATHVGQGQYYGFQVSDNGRFLLGDFTVTHNSEIISGIVKAIPCPTMILANQTVVIDQLKARIEMRKVAEEVGMFYAGKRPNGQLVVVGSIQSISLPPKPPMVPTRAPSDSDTKWKRKLLLHDQRLAGYKTRLRNAKMLREVGRRAHMVIVDEADLATSELYKDFFRNVFRGRRRYGLSGTPFEPSKPDRNMLLVSHLGSIIATESREALTASGRIIPIEYHMLTVEGDPKEASAYDIAVKEQMVENPQFWKMITKICQKYPDDGTLILVDREELGRNLQESLRAVGIEAPFIFGKTPKLKRTKILREFEKRKYKVLIGGKVVDRGLDLSGGCENLIIATGGKLWSGFNQKVGRAVRRNSKGKSRIFDFFFRNNRYLYSHSRARLVSLVEMGYKSTVYYKGGKVDGKILVQRKYKFPKVKP